MAIPLISNVGFTEVSSSGSLNTKAGDKTKLPVQFFKLSDNISGNLSLDNNSAHKKIILDTNGNNITNSSASLIVVVPEFPVELCDDVNVFNVDCTLPLPFNSSVVLELVVKGDPLEFVMLLPFVSNIIFLCAELLSKLKLPLILSDNLKNCIGSLVLSPALVFKLPLELTSVNPTFDINGIATYHLKFN